MPAKRLFDINGKEMMSSSDLEVGGIYIASMGSDYWGKDAQDKQKRFDVALKNLETHETQKEVPLPQINEEDLMAVRIQRVWRGHSVRSGLYNAVDEEVGLLPNQQKYNKLKRYEGHNLSTLTKYSATGLLRGQNYINGSYFLKKLKRESGPSWWAECLSESA